MALHFNPYTFLQHGRYYGERTAGAWEGRDRARAGVALFLTTSEERGTPADAADYRTGRKSRIAPGYLVVGLDAVLVR